MCFTPSEGDAGVTRHRGTTPPFRGRSGQILERGVAAIGDVRLGGLEGVMVRGESIDNPLLVLLHGGPGFPEARLFDHFNAGLEKLFTVVYWDRRGTNKSFTPTIPASSMTVEQFSPTSTSSSTSCVTVSASAQ